jgi:prepilin-type N-terminal cleavage/methylation domain-containing protein
MGRLWRDPVCTPSQRDSVLNRRGSSLVELVVALVLVGIVLGAASTSLLRQQRGVRWVGEVTGAEVQMRPVVRIIPSELAQLDAAAGDLVAGQASDSTLQLRAVVASSLACDSTNGTVTLVPGSSTGIPIGGVARAPIAGDSVWLFAGDTLGWRSGAIVAVSRTTTGCRNPTMPPAATYSLSLNAPLAFSGGTPVRVTRQERYVVYRSSGYWYLGLRDWSQSLARFAAPQPVAGPFIRSLPDGGITGFRYFDSTGAAVIPNGTNENSIARLRVSSLSSIATGIAADTVRRDSADVALLRTGP